MGAFLDGEWESISKLFTVEESPNLYADFLEYYSPESEQDENNPANSFSKDILFQENKTNYSTTITNNNNNNNNNNNSDCFLPDILSCIDFSNLNEEIEASLGLSFPQNNDFHNINSNNDYSNSNDNNSMNVILPDVIKSAPKRKRDLKVFEDNQEEVNVMEKPPKKNARVSQNGLKGKKKANQKSEEDMKPNLYIKESNEIADSNSDDSNAGCVSEEMNENAESNSNTTLSLTSTGKKRASRGAATDPQSLYARKRRMRINERLRILQSLVPNGTKVDISTMLEEAFHYVKFLQLQIRLLSSDDLWMYAPLAYNGLDVGAYRRLSPFIDHL